MAEGFFSRMRKAFERALGLRRPEEEIPAQEPEEIPPEYEPEEEVIIYEPPDEEVERTSPEEEGGCVTGYYPGRIEGKFVRVKPRWYADNPDIDCIHSIMASAGTMVWITFIVCGTTEKEYPSKEGEEEICLGYVVRWNYAIQAAYDSSVETAEDFANVINAISPVNLIGQWTEVTQISIVDKR